MKRKSLFLIIIFLVSLIFNAKQAAAQIPPASCTSEIDVAQVSALPTQRSITMYHLTLLGEITSEPNNMCTFGDTAFGCTEQIPGLVYPYGNSNPALVDIETDYLLDVLPREMNVAEIPPTFASLQVQAVAARSLADWKFRYVGNNVYMDNSVNYQVFIPYAYEYYALDDSVRQLISDAISSTNGQYLSYDAESIDAQFASDSINRTATCLNADYTQCHPYLLAVEDPISTWQLPQSECDAINNGNASVDDPGTPVNEIGKVWGMTQKGAIRWSKGNHCAASGDLPWPVLWDDYRQILVHYYIGIDILDANGNPVAPDDRWNLLWHDNFGFAVGEIPTLTNAQPRPLQLQLQNTSVFDWAAGEITLGYQWTPRGI